jgi:hypothetical protein
MTFGAIGTGMSAIGGIYIFATAPSVESAVLFVVSMIVLIAFSVSALSAVR